MKAAERISHVDSKKMKIEIRSAQRGKITLNQQIRGFMGENEGREERRVKNQKNENGVGVKCSVKRDLLHYMLFTVRLS